MTTMSCSQAKREGGERHGQCELKDSERRSKNLQIPKKGPRVGLGPSSQKIPKPDKALILLIISTSHQKC